MTHLFSAARGMSMMRWMALALGIAIGTMSGLTIAWLLRAPEPEPVTVDLHELDGLAVAGGVIDLIATAKRPSDCDSRVVRWLYKVDPIGDGKREQFFPILAGDGVPPLPNDEMTQYRLTLPVPRGVVTGDYDYESVFTDRCRDGVIHFRRSPIARIHIEAPTASIPAEVSVPPGAIKLLPESK